MARLRKDLISVMARRDTTPVWVCPRCGEYGYLVHYGYPLDAPPDVKNSSEIVRCTACHVRVCVFYGDAAFTEITNVKEYIDGKAS